MRASQYMGQRPAVGCCNLIGYILFLLLAEYSSLSHYSIPISKANDMPIKIQLDVGHRIIKTAYRNQTTQFKRGALPSTSERAYAADGDGDADGSSAEGILLAILMTRPIIRHHCDEGHMYGSAFIHQLLIIARPYIPHHHIRLHMMAAC